MDGAKKSFTANRFQELPGQPEKYISDGGRARTERRAVARAERNLAQALRAVHACHGIIVDAARAKKEHRRRNVSRLILSPRSVYHRGGDRKISIAQSHDPRSAIRDTRGKIPRRGSTIRFPSRRKGIDFHRSNRRDRYPRKRSSSTVSRISRETVPPAIQFPDKAVAENISKLKRRPVFQKRLPLHYVAARRPYRGQRPREGRGRARPTDRPRQLVRHADKWFRTCDSS